MTQWDVHLRYRRTQPIELRLLENRLHPERLGSSENEVWLVLRQREETLPDAVLTAISRVEDVVELPLDAVWAEQAALVPIST